VPACVVFVSPTCNKYTTEDSLERKHQLHSLLKQYKIDEILGPFITESTDGDSRRRAIQLSGECLIFASGANTPNSE
jgi:hypothetical protein